MCLEIKLNLSFQRLIRFFLGLTFGLVASIVISHSGAAWSQSEIPPEVRAALFPHASSASMAAPTGKLGYHASQPQIPEKPRHAFNDSLFQMDREENIASTNDPALLSRSAKNHQESNQGIGLTSFEGALNYQPVMDRAPEIRPNQAVSIADLPKADLPARSPHSNLESDAQLRRLSPLGTRELDWQIPMDDASPQATAVVTGMPTLAELLDESNRGLKNTRNSTAIGDKNSTGSNIDQRDDRSNNSISATALAGGDWTSLRNTGSSERFVDTLQRIAISVVLVLFLGVSFIVIAKRWLTGTSQMVQRSVAEQPISREKTSDLPKATSPNGGDTRIQIKNQLKLDDRSVLYLIEVAGQSVLVANDSAGIKSVVPILPSFADGLERLDSIDDTVHSTADEALGGIDENVISHNQNQAGVYRPGVLAGLANASTSAPLQNSHRHLDSHQDSDRIADQTEANRAENKDQQEIAEEMKRRLAELLGGQALPDVFYRQAQENRS